MAIKYVNQSCLGKKCYSKNLAEKLKNKKHKEGINLRLYYCCHCNWWHLTKHEFKTGNKIK